MQGVGQYSYEPGLAGNGGDGVSGGGADNGGMNGAVNGMMENLEVHLSLLSSTLSHPIHNYSTPGSLVDALRAGDPMAWR